MTKVKRTIDLTPAWPPENELVGDLPGGLSLEGLLKREWERGTRTGAFSPERWQPDLAGETPEERLGPELRVLMPILRRRFPPDGRVPHALQHQEVWTIVLPDYKELGREPPSIDTIARARGRRKQYVRRGRRPKNTS